MVIDSLGLSTAMFVLSRNKMETVSITCVPGLMGLELPWQPNDVYVLWMALALLIGPLHVNWKAIQSNLLEMKESINETETRYFTFPTYLEENLDFHPSLPEDSGQKLSIQTILSMLWTRGHVIFIWGHAILSQGTRARRKYLGTRARAFSLQNESTRTRDLADSCWVGFG